MSDTLAQELAKRPTMTLEAKEAVVDCLTDIVNGKLANCHDADTGICWLMRKAIAQCCNDGQYVNDRVVMSIVKRHTCQNWDYFSGNKTYPIPANRDKCGSPQSAYDDTKDKYDRTTEYGQLRLELAQELLNAFTDLEV